jgi:hypothetical protein
MVRYEFKNEHGFFTIVNRLVSDETLLQNGLPQPISQTFVVFYLFGAINRVRIPHW